VVCAGRVSLDYWQCNSHVVSLCCKLKDIFVLAAAQRWSPSSLYGSWGF